MLHTHERMKTFMRPNTTILDAHSSTEALFSIMCRSKEEVEEWIARVVAAGGEGRIRM
jgi:predicted lactoylglutathione lyase